MTPIIRPAHRTDLPDLYTLWDAQQIYHHELDPDFYTSLTPKVQKKIRSFVRAILRDKKVKMFVAMMDETCVGFIAFRMRRRAYFDSQYQSFLTVTELFVVESARRHGVASALMHRVEVWAKSHRIDCMELGVAIDNNDAKAFYTGMQFRVLGTSMIKKV